MNPGVLLILLTNMDLLRFLPAARDVLGYSPAKAADSVTVPLQAVPHHIACMDSFKDENATPSIRSASHCLNLFHAGFFIVADERDMLEILEVAGMPFISTESLARGVDAAIISGSLVQWRDAVKRGCHPGLQSRLFRGTRHAFNSVYKILCDQGLKEMFNGLQVSEQSDQTFLLEGKR